MPDSRQFDVRYLDDLFLPFDRVTKELSDKPRLVDGWNVFVTIGGKISNCPGLRQIGDFTLNKRPDRLVIYETLENPPRVFLLASAYNGETWEMYYLRLDADEPAWTSMGNLRDIDKSTRPHEILVARGLAFIKAFPEDDKYGSVIFDGTNVRPWGIPSPTVPARRTDPASWAASANPVTVNFGWRYVYCWKDTFGHYSNRSPLETDPAQQPSDTGAFENKKPQIVVQGHADTENFPYIGIFRTTDGGGTFYHLEDIPNTGAGDIIYTDQHRVATTTNDPKTDMQLDTSNIAPSMTSNTVPPPTGKTIGVDPVEPSTNMAYFARRIWYGIHRVYFSGQEEILNGVPEESFPNPNGIRGNYYIFRGQPRILKETRGVLYIINSDEIIAVSGQDRSNLHPITVHSGTGAAYGQPRAVVSYRDIVFFLTEDLQIAAVSGDRAPVVISTPLGDQFKITSSTDVEMKIFSQHGYLWLIVAVIDKTAPANTQVFVYDIQRDLWFPPWLKKISAMDFGRLRESDQNEYLVCLTWDGETSRLAVLDFDSRTDLGVPYTWDITTNLFTVPAGNHINALRQPAHRPMVAYITTERTKFAGDNEPAVSYRLDEFAGGMTAGIAQDPPFSEQHESYIEKWYPLAEVAHRVQVRISGAADGRKVEIQNIGLVFQSEAGV